MLVSGGRVSTEGGRVGSHRGSMRVSTHTRTHAAHTRPATGPPDFSSTAFSSTTTSSAMGRASAAAVAVTAAAVALTAAAVTAIAFEADAVTVVVAVRLPLRDRVTASWLLAVREGGGRGERERLPSLSPRPLAWLTLNVYCVWWVVNGGRSTPHT